MPMSDWTTNTASTASTASVTYESLVAAMAKLKPMPRDVFVYPGSIAEFKADLEASGVAFYGSWIGMPGVAMGPLRTPFMPPYGCLECWEVDGQVWIAGSYRDFKDARDGKIPITRLKGRSLASPESVSETGAD